MISTLRPWLLAICATAGFGCSTTPSTQVVTGNITSPGAIAVRAVVGGTVVTAGRVHSDGSFELALPSGHEYRLELLTSSGVKPMLARTGSALTELEFRVCHAGAPFDCGGIGGGSGSGSGSSSCDPNDATCGPPTCEVLPDGTTNCGPQCDPTTDPTCPCTIDSSGAMTCEVPPPPPPCDPTTDPNCPCTVESDGTTNCPACDPTTDANCSCTYDSSGASTCMTTCDATTDPTCAVPPPPCNDPNNPDSCQDPCMTDPDQCGCATTNGSTGSGSDATTCWPPPAPPLCDSAGHCDPNGVTPQHPPRDFGCAGT